MKKSIEIMAAVVGVIIILAVGAFFLFGTLGLKAFAMNTSSMGGSQEVSITEMPVEPERIFEHPFYMEYDVIETLMYYDDANDLIMQIPANFEWEFDRTEEVPKKILEELASMKTYADGATGELFVSTDGKMAFAICIDDSNKNDTSSAGVRLDFYKNEEGENPYKFNYTSTHNGVKTSFDFIGYLETDDEKALFETFADELVFTSRVEEYSYGGMIPDPYMWDLDFENFTTYINLPSTFQPYYGDSPVPEIFGTAFEGMGHPEKGNNESLLWISQDKTIAVRMSLYKTKETDYTESEYDLGFMKEYFGETPYKLRYTAVSNGIKIYLDFVFLGETTDEIMEFEGFADTISSTVSMYQYSSVNNTEKPVKDTFRYSFPKIITNLVLIILLFKWVFPIFRKLKNDNERSGGKVDMSDREYRKTHSSMAKQVQTKDIEMDYDHCNDSSTPNRVSYTNPRQQEYGKDYERYAYGLSLTKEDKRKKQEQYKSLLESGMIEKDEYNDKIKKLDQFYNR